MSLTNISSIFVFTILLCLHKFTRVKYLPFHKEIFLIEKDADAVYRLTLGANVVYHDTQDMRQSSSGSKVYDWEIESFEES